jgi:TRAP-type C4-dicarboxylate transport system permease small subunit
MGSQVTSSRDQASTQSWLVKIDMLNRKISTLFNGIAGAGLIAMLILVVADIVGIKLLSHPIPGGIEVVAFLGVVVIGFAMSYTQVIKGHILVDFVVSKFPKNVQAVLEVLVLIFSVITFLVLTWRCIDYGLSLQRSGEVSMTQKIPFYPFIYALALCALSLSLTLFIDMMKAMQKVVNR